MRQKNLLKIVASIRFLASQGLSFRGSGDAKGSNFYQLLALQSEYDDIMDLQKWLEGNYGRKDTSHEIQNEMIK